LASKGFWTKTQHLLGWLTLAVLAVSIISGLGWDIRTSNIILNLTGGFLNRELASDLHTVSTAVLIVLLLLHIAPSVGKPFVKKKQD
jgi:hypothetical protein